LYNLDILGTKLLVEQRDVIVVLGLIQITGDRLTQIVLGSKLPDRETTSVIGRTDQTRFTINQTEQVLGLLLIEFLPVGKTWLIAG
jgi:hypothetical protein